MRAGVFVAHFEVTQQLTGADIEPHRQGVRFHVNAQFISQLRCAALPGRIVLAHKCRHLLQQRVGRLAVWLLVRVVETPEQAFLVAHEVDALVGLVAAGDAERGRVVRAVLLAQHESAVGAAVDAGRAGDAVELVVRSRLARVVDDEQTEPELVRELLELPDDLVVVTVAVSIAAQLAHLLQRVDDDEPRVRVLAHELLELRVEAVAELLCAYGEVQFLRALYSEHPVHSSLQPLISVLKSEVEHCALVDFEVPELLSGGDVVGELCHQERFAHLRCAREYVCAVLEQAFNDRRLALVYCVVELGHRHRRQERRVVHPA